MSAAIRHLEVLAALSLTMDLASGAPIEKGLRTTAVAAALAEQIGLDTETRRAVVHTALLRAVGCTSHAPENAALFVDDVAFQRALKGLDPGDPRGVRRAAVPVRRLGRPAAGRARPAVR